MTEHDVNLFSDQRRSNWIRLRTLILLRWVAIAGQLTAILIAKEAYNLQLELGLCLLAIAVSAIGNLVAMVSFPENKRLSEFENMMMTMFDLLQLGFFALSHGWIAQSVQHFAFGAGCGFCLNFETAIKFHSGWHHDRFGYNFGGVSFASTHPSGRIFAHSRVICLWKLDRNRDRVGVLKRVFAPRYE